mgnify:CR=1 FL=1
MFGFEMNEQFFAEMQRMLPGFVNDGTPPKSQETFDEILHRVLPGFIPTKHNTDAFSDSALSQYFDAKDKTLSEISLVILSFIFGCYHCKIDLDFAQRMSFALLHVSESYRPTGNFDVLNNRYLLWLSEMAVSYILLGTVFSYKKEYIKASYYFMLGLQTGVINLNLPYCDFISYILKKLDELPKTDCNYSGCGFDKENPMGAVIGKNLIAQLSRDIISEMKGLNGEIIVAHRGNSQFYGHLTRLGSTCNSKNQMIDIYETYLIDKNYNLYKIKLFFNGYFTGGLTETIKIAKGFKLKDNSYKALYYTIISNEDS